MSKNAFGGYMGDQIGKLGTAVGFKWKGKQVYRAYQGTVRNPNTARQKLARAKFLLLAELAVQFYSATVKGFYASANSKKITQGNRFFQTNYNKISGSTPEALEISIPELTLSEGPVPQVTVGALDVSTPSTVKIPITNGNASELYASNDDEIYAFVYCPSAKRGRIGAAASRSDSFATVTGLPSAWSGLEVHAFLFVVGGPTSHYRGKASMTQYCGTDELG